MSEAFVTVTKKTSHDPKSMRDRHQIGWRALVVDTKDGIFMKSIPDPSMENGSLKGFSRAKARKRSCMKSDKTKESMKLGAADEEHSVRHSSVAFAAATAIKLNGVLVTGADNEFDSITDLKIERVHD